MSGRFDMIQDFKKEAEKIAEDEKMFQYRGKEWGEKWAEEWFRIFREHFSIGEVYEEEEEDRFVCSICGKTEPKDVEWNVGVWEDFRGEVICPECDEPTFDDLLGDDRLDFSNPENVAQFTAFVQANFTREELFPETKPIATSDSISGEVSRELETLQAQNAKLVAENQKLQQQLVAIKSLLHAN